MESEKKVTWLGVYRTIMSIGTACIPFLLYLVIHISNLLTLYEVRFANLESADKQQAKDISAVQSQMKSNDENDIREHASLHAENNKLFDDYIMPLYSTIPFDYKKRKK